VYSLVFGFFIFAVYRFFSYPTLLKDDWNMLAYRPSLWADAPLIWESYFRPLIVIVFYYSNLIIGNQIYWHYYLNIVLVLIIGFLLYSILHLFVRNRLLSSIIVMVFLVSPYAAYDYSWIAQRNEPQFIAFYLTAYYLFLLFFFLKWKSTVPLILSLACFLLALLTKETAVSLPFVVLLTILIYSNSNKLINFSLDRRQVFYVLTYLVLLIGHMFIRALFVGNVFGAKPIHSISYSAPIFLQTAALLYRYSEAVIYSFMPLTMFFSIAAFVGWVLLITVNVFLFFRLRGRELDWNLKKNILFLTLFVLIISVPLLYAVGARNLLMSSVPLSILMGYNVYSLIEKCRLKSSLLRGLAVITLTVPLMFYSINVQNVYHPGSRFVIEKNLEQYNTSLSGEERERMKTLYFERYPEYFSINDDKIIYRNNPKYNYGDDQNLVIRYFIFDLLKKMGLWEKCFD
jgi:hypothetical protein